MIVEHVKNFVLYSGECEYHLDFGIKDKVKPWGVANIYHPPLNKNHDKIRKLEKEWYKLYKLDKVTLITYNSKRNSINYFVRTIYQNLCL